MKYILEEETKNKLIKYYEFFDEKMGYKKNKI